MDAISCFTGIGGIDLALCSIFRTVAYIEKDDYCQKVLLERMRTNDLHTAPIHCDVKTFHPTQDVEVVHGGSPCQNFSLLGNGKGLQGEQSSLITEMFRIADECNARGIFIENGQDCA